MGRFGALKLAVCAVLISGLFGCKTIQPIYNTNSYELPKTSERLSQRELDAIVVEAAAKRGWKMEERTPGTLRGMLVLRAHTAVIDVRIDQSRFSINYVASTNLDERSGVEIDRNYNRWIHYLEGDIAAAVASAGRAKG